MNPVIKLGKVHVIYDQKCVLEVVELEVFEGEKVFVLGRSGSGKTTLARLIKGRIKPNSGQVRVFDQDPAASDPKQRRAFQHRVAMIDQEFYLIPRYTVISNVLSGSLGRVSAWKSMFGWYPESEWSKAESILDEVELSGLGERKVETLSGGQRQRVAIARALMQEAEIILADEPISNLDPGLGEDALQLLVQCVERRGVTLIINLHQPVLARRFASRFIGLSDGEVVYDGSPQGLEEYGTEFVYRSTAQTKDRALSPVNQSSETKKVSLLRKKGS